MIKRNIIKTVMTLPLLLGMFACSNAPKVQDFADTANPADELQRFAADVNTAREAQVEVLSPSAFQSADKQLKSATVDLQKGNDAKDVLHEVAIGRAQLDRANKFAEISRSNLEAVVAARKDAITAGAPRLYSAEFAKADDHLKSVTSEIENNNLGDVAENRGKLQKEYLDVELRAIKQTYLGTAYANYAQALKEDAKKYAKQSLAISEKKITDTEAFIVANRHQTDALKARAEEATLAASHLLKITRASKSGENVSSEQAALNLESEQNKAKLSGEQLTAERNSAKILAVETGNLKSAGAIDRSLESARKEFTKSEAEVYRQGNNLVIRLRTLEFPTNQSVLKGSNFPILAKVAKVVKGFEDSSIVIEGHTDSDGGKASNTKLSEERAEAISNYLVANNAIVREKITVMGYGYERPLASNKTPKGKAQNRRVDIIISPRS